MRDCLLHDNLLLWSEHRTVEAEVILRLSVIKRKYLRKGLVLSRFIHTVFLFVSRIL